MSGRRTRRAEAEVVSWLRKLSGRGTCPACQRPILARQETVTYMGKKHHKRCVVAVGSDK